jgi:hypothetical protein
MHTVIIKQKAQNFRVHCLARARNNNHNMESIPMPKVIAAWLEIQPQIIKSGRLYFYCYLTNDLIPVDKIEIDHLVPVVRCGNYSTDNLGVTSKKLNAAKGIRTEKEFKALLDLIASFDDKGKSIIADLYRGAGAFARYKR